MNTNTQHPLDELDAEMAAWAKSHELPSYCPSCDEHHHSLVCEDVTEEDDWCGCGASDYPHVHLREEQI